MNTCFHLRGRITGLIQSGNLQKRFQIPLYADDSQVMLCGNSAMIAKMGELLEGMGMWRDRANQPGRFRTEEDN